MSFQGSVDAAVSFLRVMRFLVIQETSSLVYIPIDVQWWVLCVSSPEVDDNLFSFADTYQKVVETFYLSVANIGPYWKSTNCVIRDV